MCVCVLPNFRHQRLPVLVLPSPPSLSAVPWIPPTPCLVHAEEGRLADQHVAPHRSLALRACRARSSGTSRSAEGMARTERYSCGLDLRLALNFTQHGRTQCVERLDIIAGSKGEAGNSRFRELESAHKHLDFGFRSEQVCNLALI